MTDPDVPPEVRFAVSQFAPYRGFEWKWHVAPIDGNYSPDAALSVTLHTVEYATASSPTQIALYRNGNYSGQGTPIAGPFVSIRHDDCTDDTVAIRLKIPGASHAGPPKSLQTSTSKWLTGRSIGLAIGRLTTTRPRCRVGLKFWTTSRIAP
jgi:hypothetical protein